MNLTFIFLLLGLLLLASIILPWINLSQIHQLRQEVDALKSRLSQLLSSLKKQEHLQKTETKIEKEIKGKTEIKEEIKEEIKITPSSIPTEKYQQWSDWKPNETSTKLPHFEEKIQENHTNNISLEQKISTRLPVWIGGISLALSGIFMVKYSIDNALLSPSIRVIFSFILGFVLLYAADWIRKKPNFANGTRISQALSGAGIVDLYACIFAATSVYQLLPPTLGFVGMAAVTALAVVLSLRHGAPIALLGLIGGFLTPTMVSSNNPSAPTLFIYLYFVIAGLMMVIRKQNWWLMTIPTVGGALLWVGFWIFGGAFSPADTLCLSLFLIAVCATVVITSQQQYNKEKAETIHFFDETIDTFRVNYFSNYLMWAGALTLIAIMTAQAGFKLLDWGLFGLLSLGGIGLAYFNEKLYGRVPPISMIVNALMLIFAYSFHPDAASTFAIILFNFSILYISSGYLLQSRSKNPLLWAGLVTATSIGYYLIAYFNLHKTNLILIPFFWGMLALSLSALSIIALYDIVINVPKHHSKKQQLLTIYAALSSAFLSIGLTVELEREFLSVAIAAECLMITWINTRVDLPSLRSIAGILAIVFVSLLVPQLLLIGLMILHSIVGSYLTIDLMSPIGRIANAPIFQLGIPALCFAIGSILLRRQQADRLVESLELLTISLIGIMIYYGTRHLFNTHTNFLFIPAGFTEHCFITNFIGLYGLLCFWTGRWFTRKTLSLSGFIICGIAIFRIIYFDLILSNPLWSRQFVGSLPIINSLILAYSLPIIWIWQATRELSISGEMAIRNYRYIIKYIYGFILLLAFTFISLNIRQIFHGTLLNDSRTTNAEIYTYSFIWLLFGIILLLVGTLRKDKMIRMASLLILLITVGKVFLYDASALEGLFRVFSFLGLGLSLVALSWFYTRFVFQRDSVQKNH